MNKRIVLSSLSIFAATALVAGATFAFFSDTETSTGNTFTAGGLDLKIDSEAHYAGLVCQKGGGEGDGYTWVLEDGETTTRPDLLNGDCGGTWTETDLGVAHKFFDYGDLKPGDSGENTISLHVIDNDAWLRLVIDNVKNWENDCTDSERDERDYTCGTAVTAGELGDNLLFSMWLDQGATPGFQGKADPGEGDNIWDGDLAVEPIITEGTIDGDEDYAAAEALSEAYDLYECAANSTNGRCLGLTEDGHIVGSVTYYIGVDWELPSDVTDIVQTDSLLADITFEVEQYRNNPTP